MFLKPFILLNTKIGIALHQDEPIMCTHDEIAILKTVREDYQFMHPNETPKLSNIFSWAEKSGLQHRCKLRDCKDAEEAKQQIQFLCDLPSATTEMNRITMTDTDLSEKDIKLMNERMHLLQKLENDMKKNTDYLHKMEERSPIASEFEKYNFTEDEFNENLVRKKYWDRHHADIGTKVDEAIEKTRNAYLELVATSPIIILFSETQSENEMNLLQNELKILSCSRESYAQIIADVNMNKLAAL